MAATTMPDTQPSMVIAQPTKPASLAPTLATSRSTMARTAIQPERTPKGREKVTQMIHSDLTERRWNRHTSPQICLLDEYPSPSTVSSLRMLVRLAALREGATAGALGKCTSTATKTATATPTHAHNRFSMAVFPALPSGTTTGPIRKPIETPMYGATEINAVTLARSLAPYHVSESAGPAKLSQVADIPLKIMDATFTASAASCPRLTPDHANTCGTTRRTVHSSTPPAHRTVGVRAPNLSTAIAAAGRNTSIAMFAVFASHATSASVKPYTSSAVLDIGDQKFHVIAWSRAKSMNEVITCTRLQLPTPPENSRSFSSLIPFWAFSTMGRFSSFRRFVDIVRRQ
eukprot:m.182155 g.182155  ORF g.182155 m.182155 type:complete len:345 (+) comp18456_c0_seq1:610-1644(+)